MSSMAGHGRHTTLPLAYLFSFEKMESYVLQLTLSEWCTVYLTMELNFLKGSTGGGGALRQYLIVEAT